MLQHRQHREGVRLDREVMQRIIARARRHIVEGVVRHREIRGADRDADEAQPDAPAIASEQLLQQRFTLCRLQASLDQPRRCIGERGTEADDRLVLPRRVHVDARGGRIADRVKPLDQR